MAKVALLIGVSEYEPGLNPLPAAVKDIEVLRRVLQDPEMGGFDEVKTLANPDRQTMESEIEMFFVGCAKDDLALLFFSGHGIKDDANKLYFASRNTQKNPKGNLIRSTAVEARFVHNIMNNSRAKRQAVILDCCFSGAFDPALQTKDDGSVDLQSQLGAEGRIVLTSSSSTQYSYEQQEADLSLYTRYLVEGIETGAGDQDEDGNISALELHEYACSKVQKAAPSMTPKILTLKDKGFEIILSKAKIADPKLRFRKEVQRYAREGIISPIGRRILESTRVQLKLSTDEATEIESEVLRPYRQRLENLQKFREALVDAVEYEYPFSTALKSELQEFQKMLGLRDEDVKPIVAELIAQHLDKSKKDVVEPQTLPSQAISTFNQSQNYTPYTVILEEVPVDKKIAVIKAVRELTGLGLKEAKDLVESVPKLVEEGTSEESAKDIKRRLIDAGGKVSIVGSIEINNSV